jgi:1-acyl-sn-glycerol-3-phosphate acyltransferase
VWPGTRVPRTDEVWPRIKRGDRVGESPQPQRARVGCVDFVYFPFVKTARGLFALLDIRLDVEGLEHFPTSGGAVVAINHLSYLDFIFGGVPADELGHRYVRYMAKDAVFRHRIAGPLMRSMKHISVDRSAGADAYVNAVQSLRDGELVGVFPEATMSRSFDIKDFKTGAARMAAEAEVPLVPVVAFGAQRMMGYGHRDFSRGLTVSITVGEPLYPTRDDDPKEVTAELRTEMITLLDSTVARYPDLPEDPSDTWWVPQRLGGAAPSLAEAKAIEEEVKAAKAAKRAAQER